MPAVWIAAEMLVTKEKQGTFGCPAFENQRKTKRTSVGCPFCGARGGSRTRTPLRALAPEASESTNSTTRAWFGMHRLLSARDILPHPPSRVNTFLSSSTIFSFPDAVPPGAASFCTIPFPHILYSKFLLNRLFLPFLLPFSQGVVKKSFPKNSCLLKFHIDFPADPGYNTLKYFN